MLHALKRPAGEWDVLCIAIPLIVSTMSWAVMTFCDRALLNHYSTSAMSAAFFASTIWLACISCPLGICMYVAAFVAQYYGNGKNTKTGAIVWQGIWASVACIPLLSILAMASSTVFELAGHADDVAQQEVKYFRLLCVASVPMLAGASLSSFFLGTGRVVVVMLVDALAAILNLLFDYLWIFGRLGFSDAGIAGAGWATLIALWIRVAVYLYLILQHPNREQYGTARGIRFNREMFANLIKFGGPAGLQIFVDLAALTAFVSLVGRLGETDLAATGIVLSIGSITALPVLGMSQATTVLVGQWQGRGQTPLARRATRSAMSIAFLFSLPVSLSFVAWPDLYLSAFFEQTAGLTASTAMVRSTSINLLYLFAGYSLLDAIKIVLVGSLKGVGDTWFLSTISMVTATVLAVVIWTGIESLQFSLIACWMVLMAWQSLVTYLYAHRFLFGKWNRLAVIFSK